MIGRDPIDFQARLLEAFENRSQVLRALASSDPWNWVSSLVGSKDKAYFVGLNFRGYTPNFYGLKYGTVAPLILEVPLKRSKS